VTALQVSWDEFWTGYDRLKKKISLLRTVNVNQDSVRRDSKQLVQSYFRDLRPQLIRSGLRESDLAVLDTVLQEVNRLADGRNARASYIRLLKTPLPLKPVLERDILLHSGDNQGSGNAGYARHEIQIIDTLKRMLPSAGASYAQAVFDLNATERSSYRGTAVEIRESLREVLHHLAPDEVVMANKDFKLEPGQARPTMRQRARYILRSRQFSSSAMKTPEDAVAVVEEGTSALVRSTYERGSASTHGSMGRAEVSQLKMYVDSVLAELLAIHTQAHVSEPE
jgi:hypothetical protein